MARKRDIKPGFFTNEDLGACSPLARLLFAGLWCWADREGRVEDRPARLRAEVLPYDHAADGEALVTELTERRFLLRYEAEGVRVIQIVNFDAHQDPHPREAPSVLPGPPKALQGSIKVRLRSAEGEPEADQGGAKVPPRHARPSSISRPSRPSRDDHSARERANGLAARDTPDEYPYTRQLLDELEAGGWNASMAKDPERRALVEKEVRRVSVQVATERLLAMVEHDRAEGLEPKPFLGWHLETIQGQNENGKPKREEPLPGPDDEWLEAHPGAKERWAQIAEGYRKTSPNREYLSRHLAGMLPMLLAEFEEASTPRGTTP